MLRFNQGYNTFDYDSYTVALANPEEPNLFRPLFPYDEVPRIGFNHRLVPMKMPKDIWITDTTFRDGQQAMPPYTVKQIVDLYKMLHRMGGPNGVIRQAEFFLYTKKDQAAVHEVSSLGYRYPEVTGWVRATRKDLALARELGLKETGILTSASDYHIYLKLRKNRKEAMEDYLSIVRDALEVGIAPRCHFEDATRADFYGFVVPFAHELMKLAESSHTPIKIRVCDTMGLGVPYPGVCMPRSIPGLIYGLQYYAGVPSEWIEWHGHNDLFMVTANAVTAWLYGCCSANGTMLGLGERTGNPPIEALLVNYLQLRGNDAKVDMTVISEMAEYFEKELHVSIPSNQPLVGRGFNTTSAGVHADGLLKNEEIYNVFNTEKLLHRPVKLAINDKSGMAGIVLWIRHNLGDGPKTPLQKDHPGVKRIYEWMTAQYETGRVAQISDAEVREQVRIHLADWLAENGYAV
ncbi:MAG: 2-isopropylmalate synthase [Kiritimatiellia bacterium]